MFDGGGGSQHFQCFPAGDDDLQRFLRHTGIPECLGKHPRNRGGYGGRFQYNGISSRQSGYYTAHGDGAGEVPRGDDQYGAFRFHFYVIQRGKLLHRCRIETGIVYRFRYFYITFNDGFTRHGTHTAYQIAPHIGEPVGRFVHDPVAFFECGFSPSGRVCLCNFDDFLHLCAVRLRHFTDTDFIVLTTVCIWVAAFAYHRFRTYLQRNDFRLFRSVFLPFGEDRTHPFLILRQVEVRVRFILQDVCRRDRRVRKIAILSAWGHMTQLIFHCVGIFELLSQEIPLFCVRPQIERVSQEVIRCRVLIHPADEI